MMYEFYGNTMKPYGDVPIHRIENRVANDPNLRPNVEDLGEIPEDNKWYIELMQKCWNHDPKDRPHFSEIVVILKEKLDSECLFVDH